jgi:DNA polymerase III epsilon subunit-like protein
MAACCPWTPRYCATRAPHPDGPEGKTLVVTHFAPSLQSADPRYGLTPGTAGFCNALDDLVAQADLWLHGHLHCPSDYRVGRCRVVANPLGYANKKEQLRFEAQAVIEL